MGGLGPHVAISHPAPAHLSAALLYKPVDRVTRSTLVLHVSPPSPQDFSPGADFGVCQFRPPTPLLTLHVFTEDAKVRCPRHPVAYAGTERGVE